MAHGGRAHPSSRGGDRGDRGDRGGGRQSSYNSTRGRPFISKHSEFRGMHSVAVNTRRIILDVSLFERFMALCFFFNNLCSYGDWLAFFGIVARPQGLCCCAIVKLYFLYACYRVVLISSFVVLISTLLFLGPYAKSW